MFKLARISSRAFQRIFTCKIWRRYSRERTSQSSVNYPALGFNFHRAAPAGGRDPVHLLPRRGGEDQAVHRPLGHARAPLRPRAPGAGPGAGPRGLGRELALRARRRAGAHVRDYVFSNSELERIFF